MKYEPPKCDCGEPLFIYEEVGFTFETSITKKGMKSKKSKKSAGLLVNQDRLRCGKCFIEWWIEHDSMGRVIRGDRF